jgi:adenylosuccinate lyase
VVAQARTHAGTLQMGRTHGVHAEPLTFGLKLTTWAFEFDRARTRIRAAADDLATGKISGPVGTYSQLPPAIEAAALERLGLAVDDASTQIVQRDRHAAFLAAIAVAGGSIERFAVEIRNLQHTELGEVGEPFRQGQTGSSAMPHKRNPILSERLTGLSRLLRGYALSGMEDQALWHERDISHSSVERVALPGATTLLHYMLVRFRRLVEGLVVRPDRMAENIERGLGLHCSSRLLTALVAAGLDRTEAYQHVQRNALRALDERMPFRQLVEADPEIVAALGADQLERCFDDRAWLTHVGDVIARLERLDP